MRLSPRHASILSAAQSFAERPLGELAKAVGQKEHVVRRVVTEALRDGVLRRRVLVNLGLQEYAVFFSAGVKTRAQRNLFKNVLLKAPYAALLLEVGGRFNFGAFKRNRSRHLHACGRHAGDRDPSDSTSLQRFPGGLDNNL